MTIDNKFEEEILSKIKQQDLKPKPRWEFLLKDYAVWFFGVLSLLIGGLAVSSILFMIRFADWGLYRQINGSFLEFIFLSVPYFWIVFLGIFVAVFNYNIKHTKQGYKYSLSLVLLFSVLSSILLGFLFMGIGVTQALDDELSKRPGFYCNVINPGMMFWDNPEEGRLLGVVSERVSEYRYKLLVKNKQEQLLDLSELTDFPPEFKLVPGVPVKFLGALREDGVFYANSIIPHRGPGRGMMHHRFKNRIIKNEAGEGAFSECLIPRCHDRQVE